ncbi:MAG: dipeptidyl-peptidase 4, partial [Frankiaceae bacterium]|nr:dipeptidyl-peptidase 4 [Frankiaceae bacterium]
LSYGGYLTTLGVSRNSNIFHVGWEMAGNSGSAAVANLASWTAPTLLEQGDDDRNVDFSDNVAVVRAIKAQKPQLEFQTHVMPNEQHEMYMRFRDLVDVYDLGGQWMLTHLFPGVANGPGDVGGSVPPTLSLTIGGPASFGPFTPGIAKDYTAATTASVTSTAGDATLSVADTSPGAAGHLVNGSFALAQALQVRATRGGADAPFGTVGATPLSLLSYTGPLSNHAVGLEFRQHVDAGDALRTGTYGKTLTFTLSTTTP